MRVTQSILYDSYMNDIMQMRENMLEISKKLSTGKKVNAPSDDPVKADPILTSKSLLSEIEQYGKNIDQSKSYLSSAEESLGSVKDVLARVSELALSQATGTANATTRSNTAIEVQALFDHMVSLGNTTLNGKYVFSGYLTGTAAFDSVGAYGGDANKMSLKVSPDSTVSIGINGGEVFKGTAGGVDVFQTVSDLITALNADDATGVSTAVSSLETAFTQISNAVADIGGKVSRINAVEKSLSALKFSTQTSISALEDADIASVISELQLSQVALEAALSSSGKVFSVNIFNYL